MSDMGSLLMSVCTLLPSVGIFGICVFYLTRQNATDSVLLTLGSGIGLGISSLYQIILPFFVYGRVSNMREIEWIYTLGAVIGFIGSLCFLTGLFLLIQKRLQLSSPSSKNADW